MLINMKIPGAPQYDPEFVGLGQGPKICTFNSALSHFVRSFKSSLYPLLLPALFK